MTIQTAFTFITGAIGDIYEEREASNIAHIVLEHITGLGKLDRIIHKERALTPEQKEQLMAAIAALQRMEPIQYITGTAWFYGLEFNVSPAVLIPRPETEELVDWIVKDAVGRHGLHILDIGTGSGCIPLSLKSVLPDASISGADVSDAALDVARSNGVKLNLDVNFRRLDALDPAQMAGLEHFDIIVSNPPYITQKEQAEMQQQVWGFEPSLALFVPDNDALLFYRHIALTALEKLRKPGLLYFEINEALGKEVVGLLQGLGFEQVELKQDFFGKDRMVKAGITA
ncbi:MAG: peptide chain release factor N(5)-glutamine methyltransferase [Chitinophaga sp.]|uniref:peptide chain release factor N(5)-glutamine methyltransferase n=1 Tax=Chitinophaga sp. TaxID=1869181 RepID=UPI0025B85AFE|nr:peptide chain release factor N(5)-glutamine methyltransferase [Chitinophaga sp.]MBV8252788.1 peptide chain release factor N(5)-glutamine methyltransferase [Chitinophaga sp.]